MLTQLLGAENVPLEVLGRAPGDHAHLVEAGPITIGASVTVLLALTVIAAGHETVNPHATLVRVAPVPVSRAVYEMGTVPCCTVRVSSPEIAPSTYGRKPSFIVRDWCEARGPTAGAAEIAN